jgi:hypothetical protein
MLKSTFFYNSSYSLKDFIKGEHVLRGRFISIIF